MKKTEEAHKKRKQTAWKRVYIASGCFKENQYKLDLAKQKQRHKERNSERDKQLGREGHRWGKMRERQIEKHASGGVQLGKPCREKVGRKRQYDRNIKLKDRKKFTDRSYESFWCGKIDAENWCGKRRLVQGLDSWRDCKIRAQQILSKEVWRIERLGWTEIWQSVHDAGCPRCWMKLNCFFHSDLVKAC